MTIALLAPDRAAQLVSPAFRLTLTGMWRDGWSGVTVMVVMAVAGCSSSSGSTGHGGEGGRGGGPTGAAGSSAGAGGGTKPGAGGGAPGTGAGGATSGAAGGAPSSQGGGRPGTTTGAGGSGGGVSSGAGGTGTAGAGGSGVSSGAGGSGPTTGTGGSGGTPTGGAPGSACAATALSNCSGTMTGGWCVDTFFQGNQNPPSLTNVWSDGPTDVWAVGSAGNPTTFQLDANGVALHWDGCAWTQSPLTITAGLHDVWGASASDVWAVGATGTALHWDGSAWSSFPTGTTSNLGAVSGTSRGDVWAAGLGVGVHWNGSAWSAVPFPSNTALALFDGDVWAVAPNDVWAALGLPDGLAHFDGTSWTKIATPFPGFGLFGIWSDGTTGWAVGEGQQIMELVGGTWTQYQGPSGSAQGYLNVMGLGGDLWIDGQAVVEGNGGGAFQPSASVPPGVYHGLWLTSSQIWMTGSENSGGVVVLHRAR